MTMKLKIKQWLRSLILTGAYLAMTLANLFAQEENINDNIKIKNAAVYYSRAFDLLKYPESQRIKNKLQQIVKNGWKEGNKELVEILEQNELCFNEVKKGLKLEKCDFTFAKEYDSLAEKELPPFVKVGELSNLLLLKARYYQKEKNFERAINIYLSLLNLARHISQDPALVSKMYALIIEQNTYAPIRTYLHSKEIDKDETRKILAYLEDYENKYFSPKELFAGEKQVFLYFIQKAEDDFKQRNIVEQEKLLKLKHAHGLIDKYFSLLIKTAESNKENDWEALTKEVENLKKESLQEISNSESFRDMQEKIKLLMSMKNDMLDEAVMILTSKGTVKLWLAISLPTLINAAKRYQAILKELKELKLLAKIKAST
jgi:hypothetical protein